MTRFLTIRPIGASRLSTVLAVVAPLTLLAALGLPVAAEEPARAAEKPVLLFSIGMHVEPFGATVSSLVPGTVPRPPSGQGLTYTDPVFFARHVNEIRTFASLVERHGGRMTVQLQTPFTRTAATRGERLLSDLQERGHEVALHFHEDAHLGKSPEGLAPQVWTAVMKEELDWIGRAGGRNLRYWSGGNLYPGVLEAARGAGLSVFGDWKNPHTQTTESSLVGLGPWRPAGGPSETDVSAFARHDAAGKVVYLPEGLLSRTESTPSPTDPAYFTFLAAELARSLAGLRTDRVNVFHVTVHPGEFHGGPGEEPYGVVEAWLRTVLDPLVASGAVRWATFGEMADAFSGWEASHPGVDPRSAGEPAEAERPRMSFVVNVHDWVHPDESAATLLRLVEIYHRNGVKGDFYLTGPMAKVLGAEHPEVLERLSAAGMTVSYHVRPPHPLYEGFEGPLRGLSDASLAAALRDYETFGLDLTTGGLLRGEPGGYTLVKSALGAAPVTVVAPSSDERIRTAAFENYRALGARMCVLYHETGTDPDQPFAWRQGLLVRPSDFSITRWKVGDMPAESFWWNMLGSRYGEDFVPRARLERELQAWTGSRPPFVTSLIHENNFVRSGPESWAAVYYEDPKERLTPKQPPFALDVPDPSRLRSAAEQEAIWAAYEEMVAWAAENTKVVTSREIVEMAGDPK